MFFERRDFFCQRTDPNFNTLLPSGPLRHEHERKGRDDDDARERFLSRAVSPSTPRSAKKLESARVCAVDNERRRTNESIARVLCGELFFFVSMRTHLCETMTKKRRARARTRGASSSSRKRALKRPYSPPLCARAGGIEFERPLFSSVAVYRRRRRVWRFVFCISFSDKKGVDILVFKKR